MTPSLTEIKALIALVMFLGAGIVGAVAAHKIDNGRYEKLVAQEAEAHAAALKLAVDQQRAYDDAAIKAAQDETEQQARLTALANSRPAEVRTHVVTKVITATCVPYGFVRLLDAAASGRSAADLPLPAGKSDDACSPLSWDAVAQFVAGNYGVSGQNSEQLNALIAAWREDKAVFDRAKR